MADMLDEIQGRNARIARSERSTVGGNALANIRAGVEEHRSKTDQEDEKITRKAFAQVINL